MTIAPLAGAEMMPVAQRIAQAAAMGTVALPTDSRGWQQLLDQFQSTGGPIPGTVPIGPATMPKPTPTNGQGDLSAFLGALRTQESGGDYRVTNSIGASGAYQFIQPTWDSAARAAGYGEYAGHPAGQAPPNVQDAVAAHMAQGYYGQFGNWEDVAKSWYAGGGFAQDNQDAPQSGGPSINDYAKSVMSHMTQQGVAAGQDPQASLGAPSAVSWAMQQVGTPYVWGGEDPSSPGHRGAFDCSGLVQATYKAIGVDLPRVAQAQYDATTKIPTSQLAPGDLVFFGSSTQNITHVGIYIGANKMVDAPHAGAYVRTEDYRWGDFVGATRPSDPTGQSIQAPVQQAPQTQGNNPNAVSAYYTVLSQVMDALSRFGATT